MLYPGIGEVELSQFNGAITRLEPYSVGLDKALYAQNVSYVRGYVSTRFGHSAAFSLADGAITAMANWFFVIVGAQVSVVAYYSPSVGVRALNQLGPTVSTIMTVTGAAGAVMVPNFERLYTAFYDASGRLGFAGGQIYGWSVGSDPLFAAPLTYTPVASEAGAGLCTAGTRRIGYITTTRNGYTGNLQPVPSSTFVPTTFTSTGGKNLQVTITGVMPSYMTGGTIQIVMTTVANKNQYFTVPGATSLANNPTTITLSISDNDLAATGTDVTSRITLLTQLGSTPPFLPHAMWTYSARMCYATFDKLGFPVIYISNPNDYQFVTADQHGIQIEGQQHCVNGFSLRGVCYMACTSGFYATEDNGGVPVSWTPAQRVDGSIGIISATCLYANPSAGYALVASERGFYLFQGGIFPPKALSYYQDSDWSRINWNVPTQVQVAEDTGAKEFIVIAPLNTTIAAVSGVGPYTVTTTIPGSAGAPFGNNPHLYQTGLVCSITGVTGTPTITVTGPNTFTIPGGNGAPTVGGSVLPQTASAIMKWNYTPGDTPELAQYSIDSFTSYRTTAVAVVRTLSTLLPEVYYAPAANGPIIRKNNGSETLPFRDVDMSSAAAAINDVYKTALVPNPLQAGMTTHDYYGAHMAVRGNGLLSLLAQGLNGIINVTPAASPITLQANPNGETLVRWQLWNERQALQVGTNAVDHFFVLSLLRLYYSDKFAVR